MVKPNNGGTTGADREKSPVAVRVPLFSRRSIIGLMIGLIVGVGLGVGYWIVSPSIAPAESDNPSAVPSGGFLDFLVESDNGPWASWVAIQVVSPGSSPMTVRELLSQAQYYAAKLNSRPFLRFLSQQLADEEQAISHTAEELAMMIELKVDSRSEPPAINVMVTADTVEETLFLTTFVPEAFQRFLVSEENAIQQSEYQKSMKELEVVRAGLVTAQEERAALAMQESADALSSNPTYVSLNATAEALRTQLNRQASELAALIAQGDVSQNYTDNLTAVRRLSEALASARKQIAQSMAEHGLKNMTGSVDYQIALRKVESLQADIARLTNRLGALDTPLDEKDANIDSLAVGTPTMPSPVLPERARARNVLLGGALIGMVCAWGALNFRWLSKGMPSSTPRQGEEEA